MTDARLGVAEWVRTQEREDMRSGYLVAQSLENGVRALVGTGIDRMRLVGVGTATWRLMDGPQMPGVDWLWA